MDFDEYQRMALTTAIYPDRGNNLAYPALGLGGEAGEICEKARGETWRECERRALAKELGDVIWYAALMADELGEKLGQVAAPSGFNEYQEACLRSMKVCGLADAVLGLASAAGGVCDKVKKMFRDDGGTLTDARRAAILAELGGVLEFVAAVASELGESLGRVAEMNIEKLMSRRRRGTIVGDGDDR